MTAGARSRATQADCRAAFTLVETLVALAIAIVVIAGAWGLFTTVVGTRRASAVRLTGASLLRQDLRLALEKLLDRIEEGIEILEPTPGSAADHLVFKDMLNHTIHLGINSRGELVTRLASQVATSQDEGPAPRLQTVGGSPVAGILPVRIPQVARIAFRVSSPQLVSIELTLADGGQNVTVVMMGRLQNRTLADD